MPYSINTKVVGTTYRNNGAGLTQEVWDKLVVGTALRLVHDPAGAATGEGHKDPTAIAVYLEDELIGYVPKDTAQKVMTDFRDAWESGRRAEVTEITGGYGAKSNKGINIRLYFMKVPEEIALTAGFAGVSTIDLTDPNSGGQM